MPRIARITRKVAPHEQFAAQTWVMRIISGRFKSRRLKATPPAGIRPTSDKLKETIFNVLHPTVEGATFFDGCAGMGSIGIEALSRGARRVYFVEQSRKACQIIRENLQLLGIEGGYKILEMDLIKALDLCIRDGVHFDIAFLDPPYERTGILWPGGTGRCRIKEAAVGSAKRDELNGGVPTTAGRWAGR
ncbi:MAG: 16S rRNA (guanine(966)-N(2))-methyltransferase RsmD [Acidobacteria bacterium]|nr:MAG: 16S rRNA (guanine(966)-N(2))-methyltransferase RsmD [Acidobacteriota bacterium]